MVSNDCERNKIVKALITRIFMNKDILLTRLKIHKILFKLKVELPEYNTMKDYLPFYWYDHGPYSEVIDNNINDLVDNGYLTAYPEEDYILLGIADIFPNMETGIKPHCDFALITDKATKELTTRREYRIDIPNIDDFEYAVKRITYINKYTMYNFKPFVRDIYLKYEPYVFMHTFNLDFRDQLEVFKIYLGRKQRTLDEYLYKYPEVDRLEDILYDCEADIPLEDLFIPFNNLFSSFITGSSKIFDYVRKYGDNLYSNELLYLTSDIIWKAFAKGVRILKHDNFYDNKLEEWNYMYKASLTNLSTSIDRFNKTVLEEIRRDRLFSADNLNERSKRILSSVVSGYLS